VADVGLLADLRKPPLSANVARAEPSGGGGLKFFTEAWSTGEMPDEEAAGVPAAYEAHLRELAPPLPADARRLVNELSLHDGLLRSVSRTPHLLEILVRAGDNQTGYFDAHLRYGGAEVTEADERFLRGAWGQREVELLYDEFDSADSGWIHRISFSPYREVCVRFAAFELRVTPAGGRFDEGAA
jgi:hypothetical protein